MEAPVDVPKKDAPKESAPTDTPMDTVSQEPYNVLSPEEYERRKTKEQQAEDIAYTINHSLYCTLTDFLNPPINAATDGYLRRLFPGCGHDHSQDGGHHHHHHDHGPNCSHDHHHHHDHHHPDPNMSRWERVKLASKNAFSKERFWAYAKGEFIGDFGAVPLTIGIQRGFPNFMHGLRKLCEPIAKPIFKLGVERDSKNWAKENHVEVGSEAYNDRKQQVYEYEMSHFPQAVVWTGFSFGLNTAYQVHTDKTPMPLGEKWALKSSSVLSGILVTAGMVVAARAFMPYRMHDFDSWMGRNAIMPTTKGVAKMFGVKEEDVDRMAAKHEAIHEGQRWAEKVQQSPPADAEVVTQQAFA